MARQKIIKVNPTYSDMSVWAAKQLRTEIRRRLDEARGYAELPQHILNMLHRQVEELNERIKQG